MKSFVLQGIGQIASAPSRNVHNSDSMLIDSNSYCLILYGSNQASSGCSQRREDTELIAAQNRNYFAKFQSKGEHRKHIEYPISSHPLSLPGSIAFLGDFNY